MKLKIHPWKITTEGCDIADDWTDRDGRTTVVFCPDKEPKKLAGARRIEGTGGGTLIFLPDGAVVVQWMETAAIASAHGSGNRTMRITEPGGTKLPPRLTDMFSMVANVRRIGRDGFDFPEDHKAPGVLKRLEIFQRLAWHLLRSVAMGDAAAIRKVADAVEACDALRESNLVAPGDRRDQVCKAINSAARQAKGIPTRAEVLALFNKITPVNMQVNDLRDDLTRMGFGWLPSPSGRPPKKVNSKGTE